MIAKLDIRVFSVSCLFLLSCVAQALAESAVSNDTHGSIRTVAMVIDSDSDGIDDSIEGTADPDGDGVPNYLDLDSDNDGITDRSETDHDLDGDLIPNFLDLDSNGNGSLDYYESRIINTITYLSVAARDSDSDGQIDPSHSFGINGYADFLESSSESGERNYTLADIDTDGVHDYRDLDMDNDGISNLDEKLYGPTGDDHVSNAKDPDSDNDGIFDVVEVYGIEADQDRDGKLDSFVDEDGDGLSDLLPSGVNIALDTDADGKPDAYDLDSDGDGIKDYFENWGYDVLDGGFIIDSAFSGVAPQVWSLPNEIRDTDNDGLPDFRDTDANDNGLSDLVEAGAADLDSDGFADAILDESTIPDTDADGIADFQEYEPGINGSSGDSTPSVGAAQGSGGGGCSVVQNTRPDPLFFILILMSTVVLRFRGINKRNQLRNWPEV